MAARLEEVAELLKEHFKTPFIKSLDRDIFALSRFKRTSGVGKEYQWKIHYAGNDSAGSYGETDFLVPAGQQAIVPAMSPFRQNWVTVEVTGLAQAATRGSGGYMEALAFEAKEALEDLKNEINIQLLQDSSDVTFESTDIDGVRTIVSNTGTYAGIDRATHTWFQSYVLDNGGVPRALTIALMQDVMAEMERPLRKAKISGIWTSRTQYYAYGSLMEDRRRWVNEMTLDGGYKALDFEGVPVIAVPRFATDTMLFLDESEFHYCVLQDFETTPKSTNTDSDRFIITHYSQLICEHTGRQARIDDLS